MDNQTNNQVPGFDPAATPPPPPAGPPADQGQTPGMVVEPNQQAAEPAPNPFEAALPPADPSPTLPPPPFDESPQPAMPPTDPTPPPADPSPAADPLAPALPEPPADDPAPVMQPADESPIQDVAPPEGGSSGLPVAAPSGDVLSSDPTPEAPAVTAPEPTPAPDPAPAAEPAAPAVDELVAAQMPAAQAAAPTSDPDWLKNSMTPGASTDDLDEIKQAALKELAPIAGELDQPPKERFDTLLQLIQATDNFDLVKPAFESAKAIDSEKDRASALLEIVNEVNYLENKDTDGAEDSHEDDAQPPASTETL